jgi:hypothetical protein
MREQYGLEKICHYLKIDINKRVNVDEAWIKLLKSKEVLNLIILLIISVEKLLKPSIY